MDSEAWNRAIVGGLLGRGDDARTLRRTKVLPHPNCEEPHRAGQGRYGTATESSAMTISVPNAGTTNGDSPAAARIPVAGPWVTELEIRYVSEAAANDWYAGAGQSV